MDYLTSMYIDNELDLNEKVQFVDRVHRDHLFYQNTQRLLRQEKLLRTLPDTSGLPARLSVGDRIGHRIKQWLKPVIYAAAGFATAGLVAFSMLIPPTQSTCATRFVIYNSSANQVELAGSFTGWQRKSMQPIRNSGYWEIYLQVTPGEHRFAYILDGDRQIADPTLPASENDDFGGRNSILNVEGRI